MEKIDVQPIRLAIRAATKVELRWSIYKESMRLPYREPVAPIYTPFGYQIANCAAECIRRARLEILLYKAHKFRSSESYEPLDTARPVLASAGESLHEVLDPISGEILYPGTRIDSAGLL